MFTQWLKVDDDCVCTFADGWWWMCLHNGGWLMMNVFSQWHNYGCWWMCLHSDIIMVVDGCVRTVTDGWLWMCSHSDRWSVVNVFAQWQMVNCLHNDWWWIYLHSAGWFMMNVCTVTDVEYFCLWQMVDGECVCMVTDGWWWMWWHYDRWWMMNEFNTEYFIPPITGNYGVNLHIKST